MAMGGHYQDNKMGLGILGSEKISDNKPFLISSFLSSIFKGEPDKVTRFMLNLLMVETE